VEGLFADEHGVIMCSNKIPTLKKLLKFASKWARNNEMQLDINKCVSSLVVS